MAEAITRGVEQTFGQTERKDLWWIEPLIIGAGFGLFGLYATWAAFQGNHYEWGPYLSPFYSPLLQFDWMPKWFSPAFLILPFPLLFRATCYYYRKAYYRAYFTAPPACAVGGLIPPGKYKGETAFPFILQNLHRYTLYAAIVILAILWWDALLAFNFGGKFGVGLGSLILLANVVLLSLYTFSCHSLRHIIGGNMDCFSCDKVSKVRHTLWERATHINEHHMRWAWLSLFSVGFSDVYIRLLSMGVITDLRFF